jgi:hypothetical protein
MNDNEFLSKRSSSDLISQTGIEVKEVEFKEFDRRLKSAQNPSQRRLERRGFITEVEHLIQDINIKTARAYSTRHLKK